MPSLRILVCGLLAVVVAVLAGACGSAARPELVATDVDQPAATPVLVIGEDPDGGEGADEIVPFVGRSGVSDSARAILTPAVADGSPLVVLDTDMGPDIDDALALAMLHGYADRGQAEIAAVTLSRNSVTGARFIDALNTAVGHPDIPIGIDRRSPYQLVESGSYVALADRWPNDVANADVADGVSVLRRALTRAIDEGRPIVLVQVGFSGNTAALLDSGPDDISPLSGPDLVLRSGAVLSIMAGSMGDGSFVEFNIANDVAPARRVLTGWPGDLVLSPFQLGYDLHYPYAAIRDRLPADGSSLLRTAYEFRDHDWHVDAPPFYDMRAWDLTSVMQGVEPEAGWFPVSAWGTITIDDAGHTGFVAGDGRHRFLDRWAMSGDQMTRARDRMIDLVTASGS